MRIAHINNLAGVASLLAKEQAIRGIDAQVFVNNHIEHRLFGGTKVDIKLLSRDPKTKVCVNLTALLGGKHAFLEEMKGFDIIHVHGPYPWLLKMLEPLQKKMILHFHGSELRAKGKYLGPCLVATPDLLQYAQAGRWAPNPVEVDLIDALTASVPAPDNKVPVVAHYPYYKMNKHPDVYSQALKNLERAGKCKILEVFNVPHKEALELLWQSDVVIGKIMPRVGWFGKFELEAMAMGKPVITYVSDTLMLRHMPPISLTSVDTFEKDLGALLDDHIKRQTLGALGKRYVRDLHDPKAVVDGLMPMLHSN